MQTRPSGVIFLHDAAILFSILSPCVMKSGRDVSICRAGAALYGSVIATAPFLIRILRAGMEFVPFDLLPETNLFGERVEFPSKSAFQLLR